LPLDDAAAASPALIAFDMPRFHAAAAIFTAAMMLLPLAAALSRCRRDVMPRCMTLRYFAAATRLFRFAMMPDLPQYLYATPRR